MATRKLDKKEWRSFFDHLSTTLEGKQAEIEVLSLQLGDQVEADWLPLLGIAYDPNDDIVEVALEGLDHLDALDAQHVELPSIVTEGVIQARPLRSYAPAVRTRSTETPDSSDLPSKVAIRAPNPSSTIRATDGSLR
jgi:hypothetical protein